MEFDILSFTEEELNALTVIQVKLLRTAQQKKNELYRKMEKEKLEYRLIVASNNANNSTLYGDKCAELEIEFNYQIGILREQLVYNMSLNEPTTDGELGGAPDTGDTPYEINYELSYLERYISVRDYYMTIEDPVERLALLQADTVAQRYLSSYYNTLYNYLSQFV